MLESSARPGLHEARRLGLARPVLLCCLVLGVAASTPPGGARAQQPAVAPAPERPPSPVERSALVVADSARARAERRLQALAALPDSERVQALDQALEELGGAIATISRELSTVDFQIEDQAISLRDKESGGRIRIEIPPDLGRQISQGISSITATILAETPDTIVLRGYTRDLKRIARFPDSLAVVAPGRALLLPRQLIPSPPRVIAGDMIRVFGDVVVNEDDEVSGSAIAVFGNVIVRGRVNDHAIAVFGRLDLGERARVGGDAVAVGGQLDRGKGTKVGGRVFALNPGPTTWLGGADRLLWRGWIALAWRTALFIVAVIMLAVFFAFIPPARLTRASDALRLRPGACLGQGLLWLIAGHLLVGFLMGVFVLTVIGIPLALLIGLAYLGVALLAVGVASWQLGRAVLPARGDTPPSPFRSAVVGLLLLHLPGLIGSLLGLNAGQADLAVAFGVIGLVAKFVAFALGLGAIVLSRFGAQPAAAVTAATATGGVTAA